MERKGKRRISRKKSHTVVLLGRASDSTMGCQRKDHLWKHPALDRNRPSCPTKRAHCPGALKENTDSAQTQQILRPKAGDLSTVYTPQARFSLKNKNWVVGFQEGLIRVQTVGGGVFK